jgi:Flp pilus assembly protein CpaB
MNRSRFLLIAAVALAIGFLVSVWVYRKLQLRAGVPAEPNIDVMVAANDLQVGSKIQDHDIRIAWVPLSMLPPGAPRKHTDVIGRGAW